MVSYSERPWLSLYAKDLPADIAIGFGDVVQMWRRSVADHPDRTLVHYFDRTYSLAEIDADSDALAAALAHRGVGQHDRVALYLQNVPQFVVTMLAVWKLGGIAVPVNPMLKDRELIYLLNDCNAKAIVCLQELWNSVAMKAVENTTVTTVVTTSPLDGLGAAGSKALSAVERVETPGAEDLATLVGAHRGQRPGHITISPSDIATLTYTSGTTGDPKGAMNTHRNVVFNAEVYRQWIGLTDRDVCLAGAPLFHITGLIGHLAVAILLPMPMVLGYRFDAATMNELAERHRATFSVMAITAYTAMMNEQAARRRDLSSLSKLYSCGAPIAPSLVDRFEREVGVYIHNIYGLTETTAPSHAVPYGQRAPVDPATGALSIGVPVFNTIARIVDEHGDDVTTGQLGEIAIAGPGVVPGYWHQPAATSAALPDGEMRTGDIGFVDDSGWFYLVDRKKDMIVAGGYKVWPREVEDVLLEHPAVREAIVIGVPDEYRGETVKAFVSMRRNVTATPSELRDFCRQRLAAYKCPRQVEIMDDLPKTATGKPLRRAMRS